MWAIKMILCFVITWTTIFPGIRSSHVKRSQFKDLGLKKCKSDVLGWDYTGSISKTRGGIPCLNWNDVQIYHKPSSLDKDWPDSSLQAAGSKCRNPDKSPGGPWCYTSFEEYTRTWHYCDIPWCSTCGLCPALKQISYEDVGGYLASCKLLQGQAGSSLEACKDLTCHLGGNAFNFKGTQCYVKSCRGNDYGWSNAEGYNVYAIDMCPADFTLKFDKSVGVASECTLVACHSKISVEACKQYTCAKGANTINYSDNSCCIKRCEIGDMKLTTRMGGYDVYTLDTRGWNQAWCYTNFKLASPMSAGKISDCTYITGFNNVNLDFCMEYACNNYYNVFNYKDNSCVIKQCESSKDLKLIEAAGGQDVYSTETCVISYKLAYPKSVGKAIGYPPVKCINGISLQGCKNYACALGYNAFNFRDNTCCVMQGVSLGDLKLTKTDGGYDVYVKDEGKPARRSEP